MEPSDAFSIKIKPTQVAAGLHETSATMPLPKGYSIDASNLFYTLNSSGFSWESLKNRGNCKSKIVLKNVSCRAKPGEILAVAGPSGAGKSTLLEILGGRVRRASGSVRVNRLPMTPSMPRRLSAFVTQDDALFPLLTVHETLLFSARLRLPASVPDAEKTARVAVLLDELGLNDVASCRVGGCDWPRGISGGERRRVSIGVDVIHDPAVLLLDEPTSGLDSAAALNVAAILKRMTVKNGRTVVLSIHQPSYRILELFDSLLLLSDGTVVHQGTLNELSVMLMRIGHFVPSHVNVLEFAIDNIDSLDRKSCSESLPLIRAENMEGPVHPRYANKFLKETMVLSQRFWKNIIRTRQLFMARTVQALVAGTALGTIFLRVGNDEAGIQDRVGFFAFSLTFLLSSTTEGLPIFLEERNILLRETSRGAYRVSSYVIANALVFLPFLLLVALLYAAPVYWLVGLRPDIAAFFYFVVNVWLVLLMANSFVACFSAAVPNFIMGNSVVAGLMGGFFLFSGYFIASDDIPKYWIFMHYLSLFKYPFESFLINEFSRCFESVGGQCVVDGHDFLRGRGLRRDDLRKNTLVILFFVVFYRFMCFVVLSYRCSRGRISM